MTGSVHVALGAAIGRFARCPPLAFTLGLASHWLGDVVPHRDLGIGETPLVFATLARVIQQHGIKSPQFWGSLGAILPDFEHIPYELRKDPRRFEPMEEKFFPTHNGRAIHGGWKFDPRLGLLMQIVLYLAALWLAGSLGTKR